MNISWLSTGSRSGIFNTNTHTQIWLIYTCRFETEHKLLTNKCVCVYTCRFQTVLQYQISGIYMQMYWNKLSYFPLSVDFPQRYVFDRISHRLAVKSHKCFFLTLVVFLINDVDIINFEWVFQNSESTRAIVL